MKDGVSVHVKVSSDMTASATIPVVDGIFKPLTVGVFGGSFNPIHLGHALLAITTQQTKNVDQVVLVPVYKHAVKRDLLPFEDRVTMCQLAVENFGIALSVSTIEKTVGASNGAMLRGLKAQYPEGTRFLWICGDDFLRWMERPKGLETLEEVSGLIVQRRLHKADDDSNGDGSARFYKEPIDEDRLQAVANRLNLTVDFIYGELPHFSSTLVRRAPGKWRSFLPIKVAKYLDDRPHLLDQLIENLEQDAIKEKEEECSRQYGPTTGESTPTDNVVPLLERTISTVGTLGAASSRVMRALDAVHALQWERGRTGLQLSTGNAASQLLQDQANTDFILREILEQKDDDKDLIGMDEVLALDAELKQIPVWLERDRAVLAKRSWRLTQLEGSDGWNARYQLVAKFNARIDVLIAATIRSITEILEFSSHHRTGHTSSARSVDRYLPELVSKWCEGKEALGRVRAFVCAGGPMAPSLLRSSLQLRERLNQVIDTKDRSIARVLSLEAGLTSQNVAAPEALHRLLERVTYWEWSLMGCFASSTPLWLIHKMLADDHNKSMTSIQTTIVVDNKEIFDVNGFFEASTAALDFLLAYAKALAASGVAAV